jgi:SAM-dependent methyltransferase
MTVIDAVTEPVVDDVERPLAEPATSDVTEPLATPVEPLADEYGDPVRYDLEYGVGGVDLAFYRALAAEAEGSVLDLATGTGRVALDLAREGHTVTAVDINPAMLAHAAEKPGADEVTWVEQDARTLKLRTKFGLAVLAGNALHSFVTNEDRDAVLKAVHRQLAPGGRFAFAVRFPHASDLARRSDAAELWHTYTDLAGREVVVSGTQHYHPVAQVMHHTTYRHFAFDGTPAAAPTSASVRYHFPQELEAALKSARFEVEARYGDFAGSPLGEQALVMVYVCRKPQPVRRSA